MLPLSQQQRILQNRPQRSIVQLNCTLHSGAQLHNAQSYDQRGQGGPGVTETAAWVNRG